MGMISPVWEEAKEQLEGPMTRITLRLQDDEAARETTMQQFHELQDTLLLFTKNLRRLEVAINDNDNGIVHSVCTSEPGRTSQGAEKSNRSRWENGGIQKALPLHQIHRTCPFYISKYQYRQMTQYLFC